MSFDTDNYPVEPSSAGSDTPRTAPPSYPADYDTDGQPNAPEIPEGTGSGVTVAGVSPNTAVQGTDTAVTITGTHIPASPTVTVSGTGITVSSIVRHSPKMVTATFTASGAATVSNRTVTVAGVAKTNAFAVTASP